jgi:hypothetical protein
MANEMSVDISEEGFISKDTVLVEGVDDQGAVNTLKVINDPNYSKKTDGNVKALASFTSAISSVSSIRPASVVHGILLSEILGPPKCRRFGLPACKLR